MYITTNLKALSLTAFAGITVSALTAPVNANDLRNAQAPHTTAALKARSRAALTIQHRWTSVEHYTIYGDPPSQAILYTGSTIKATGHLSHWLSADLSPDGKICMCTPPCDDYTLFGPLNSSRMFARKSSGKRWTSYWDWDKAIWMPDSDHWVQWRVETKKIYAVEQSVKHRNFRRIARIPLPKESFHGWDGPVFRPIASIDTDNILVLTNAGFVHDRKPTDVSLVTFALSTAKPNVHVSHVFLPVGTEQLQVAYARRRRVLAWIIGKLDTLTPLSALSIVVTDINGTYCKQIWSFTEATRLSPASLHEQDLLRLGPRYLTWSPDEKRLQFVLQGAVWTIPVGDLK